ncbi:hypothetical protein ACHAPJ_002746 [Fusarium lateritium]
MNATKWRISKACQECRAKKIKCNGETPCQNCRMRSLSCVYREKARNRTRKVKPRTAAYETIMSHDAMESTSLEPSDEGTVPPTPNADDAASTGHAASVMESERRTCPNDPTSRSGIVEEVGPGLDLFSHRRLFFGDLADNQRPTPIPDDCTAMLINPETAHRLLERYLLTYWHGLPVMSKDDYRRRLDALFRPPGIFDYDAPETIIIMLAVGLGASMTGEEAIAEFLFQKTKQGAAKLDEVVSYTSAPHAGKLLLRAYTRMEARAQGTQKTMQINEESLSGVCSSGKRRPSSIPDPGSAIPLPKDQKLLKSLITLSRIMDKCVKRIYSPRHDSLLPVWNAAVEIRRELHQFAEQQLKDMKFGLVGDPSTGELGDIKYHGFFIEGACYALAFDMLQEKKTAHRNLPWIHSGLRCLRSMMGTAGINAGQLPITIASIEQMVRSAGFELKEPVESDKRQSQLQHSTLPGSPAPGPLSGGMGSEPAFTFPSMPFGFDVTGQLNGTSPVGMGPEETADFTAADVGWDIDFGTMNMEAFLSLDSAEAFNFAP